MAASERIDLLSNASATGGWKVVPLGGRYIWAASATWAGATGTLQFLGPDGATAIDVTDNLGTTASLTANGAREVVVAAGSQMRVSISGSPTGVYSTLVRAAD